MSMCQIVYKLYMFYQLNVDLRCHKAFYLTAACAFHASDGSALRGIIRVGRAMRAVAKTPK